MPSSVKDIKFVDLKRSTWNEKKSNRKNGEYDISNKVYYRNRDFREGYIHPYKLKWCRYTTLDNPPYASWEVDKIRFKAAFLTFKDDYWPEGIPPDSEGKYVFRDVVAAKIPIQEWVQHKKQAKDLSERQSRDARRMPDRDAVQEDVSDEVERMVGETRDLGL